MVQQYGFSENNVGGSFAPGGLVGGIVPGHYLTEVGLDTGDIVVLREYSLEIEARFAATVLEANGVPSKVVADTAGGALPSMALVFPVRLLVRAEDAALARELLDTPAEPRSDDDTNAP
jgi:hypothetical protein